MTTETTLAQKLNITLNGRNGEVAIPGVFDLSDGEIRRTAAEVVRNGEVETLNTTEVDVDTFNDFVVERFSETGVVYLRPKTPFG